MSRPPRTRGSRSRDRGSEDFSRSNGYGYDAPPLPATRPLQPRPRVPSINGGYGSDRDRDRFGTSPSNSRMHYEMPSRASPAPSRPARSDRRPINSIASDSLRQGHSPRPSFDEADPYGGMDGLNQPQLQSQSQAYDDQPEPKALGTVISAFQNAGFRRGVPDRERERQIEQRDRIREREPGRRIKGRRGTLGEIDGENGVLILLEH
jgi:hypothetical protein